MLAVLVLPSHGLPRLGAQGFPPTGVQATDKKMTTLGLEPRISRSVVGCLIQLGQAAKHGVNSPCAHKTRTLTNATRTERLQHTPACPFHMLRQQTAPPAPL